MLLLKITPTDGDPATTRGPWLTGASRNVRPVLDVPHQRAPDPVAYGLTPSRPARMPIATFFNVNGIRAVMRDSFVVPLWSPSPAAATLVGPGPQLDWRERTNIKRQVPDAYGSQVPELGSPMAGMP